jgi:hypothetical protein
MGTLRTVLELLSQPSHMNSEITALPTLWCIRRVPAKEVSDPLMPTNTVTKACDDLSSNWQPYDHGHVLEGHCHLTAR